MRNLIYILTGLVMLTSCATTKVEKSADKESENLKNLFQQAEIKQAVEMRRFIIKFDRLYVSYGGSIDLVPKSNYIILDGDKAIISAAYIGRQYSGRPVRGIDMRGQVVSFEMKNKSSKGVYEIRMKIKNDKNTFDVFVSISNNGYCNASLASYKIDHVRYTGNFIPMKPKEEQPDPEGLSI